MNSSTSSLLRDKFTYQPNSTAKMGYSPNDPSHEETLKTLLAEYSELSPSLINAIFKQNSMSLSLSRKRLDHIVASRTGGSWKFQGKPSKIGDGANAIRSPPHVAARLTSLKESVVLKPGVNGVPLNLPARASNSSKITVERQRNSIFDRYSHVMKANQPSQSQSRPIVDRAYMNRAPRPLPPIKKGKLVRGDAIKKKKVKLSDDEEEEDRVTDDSAAEDGSDSEPEYQEKSQETSYDQVLDFLNKADARDLADLADLTLEKAQLVVKERPFEDLDQFQELDLQSNSPSPDVSKVRRSQQKRDGVKILEKIEQSIKGYNAIESLINKCSSYGNLISKQMKGWGVDIDSLKDGELNIMDIEMEDEDDDEGYDDSSKMQENTGSVEPVKPSGSSKRKRDDEEEDSDNDYEESDDDDFDLNPKGRARQNNTSIMKLASK